MNELLSNQFFIALIVACAFFAAIMAIRAAATFAANLEDDTKEKYHDTNH